MSGDPLGSTSCSTLQGPAPELRAKTWFVKVATSITPPATDGASGAQGAIR